MTRPDSELVGREGELDALHAFVDDRMALPKGLVIEGPAGAGKTTLWRAAVDHATDTGYLVLACRPAGAEVQLSLGAIADLLEPHLAKVLPALPAPQRHAVAVALLVEDGGDDPPDQRALAAGFLNAIRSLAEPQPLLIAIDDAQWMDGPSAGVIEYALRRLGGAPVAVLAAVRATPGIPAGGLHIERALERPPARLDVGPLSIGALRRLIGTRTELELDRRTLQRIHETSGGNPFYALELAREIEARPAGLATGTHLSLSAGLNELLTERLAGLGQATRDALVVAAAAAEPTLELVGAVTGQDAASNLAPAVAAAIVRIDDDRIHFVHPLLAAATYAQATPNEQRSWHARLADASQDPEARARHLSLARPGRDLEVAEVLHDAARHALGRAASGAASELFAEAIDRLPPGEPDKTAAWAIEAAPTWMTTGEIARARRLLEAAIVELPAGVMRADALLLLGPAIEGEPGGAQREEQLAEQSYLEAGGDVHRQAAAMLDREIIQRSSGHLAASLDLARQALVLAERDAAENGDESLLAHAHVRVADLEVLHGIGGDPVTRFQAAMELDDRVHVDASAGAPAMLSVCLIRAGRVDEARPLLLECRLRAIADGNELGQVQICTFLTELEWLAGRWDEARRFGAEGVEVAEQLGNRMRFGQVGSMLALVEASDGDPALARELGESARDACDEVGDVAYANYARGVLGFLELSLGNAGAAHELLNTYSVEHGVEGPKRLTFLGEDIEARVLLGDLDGARTLVDEVRRRGSLLHRPPLIATAARGEALLRVAQGDLDGALRSAGESVETYAGLRLPFEHARSLLVRGEVERRLKQRRAARDTLTTAIEAFERLGAARWAARAEAERARIGGRSTIEGLSETELRVAQLVAAGRSNKEVAAELFVSVRAVEANLSKVYAKLGIRSRTELARRI